MGSRPRRLLSSYLCVVAATNGEIAISRRYKSQKQSSLKEHFVIVEEDIQVSCIVIFYHSFSSEKDEFLSLVFE